MDLREATACLDEYRISLANIGGMLRPNVADGELGEVIKKLNDRLIETLNAQVKEARVLSILIWEEMKATHAQVVDFPDEWADLLVALNQLKLATDTAAEAQAEYLKTATSNVDAKGNELSKAIREFRRRQGLMTKEQIEEYDRNMSQKGPPDIVKTLNTPDPTESDRFGVLVDAKLIDVDKDLRSDTSSIVGDNSGPIHLEVPLSGEDQSR